MRGVGNASTSQTFYDQFWRWNLFSSPKVYKYLFVFKKKKREEEEAEKPHNIVPHSQCGQVYYANCGFTLYVVPTHILAYLHSIKDR